MKARFRRVAMYDLFSKGNYVGSFPTKAAAEDELGLMTRKDPPGRANEKRFTVIRSTHYLFDKTTKQGK